MDRMIAIDEHPARLSDRRRAEPRAGAVRRAEIEGNAGNANRGVRIRAGDPEKSRRNRKGRDRRHG
jgi:hypothetical protein